MYMDLMWHYFQPRNVPGRSSISQERTAIQMRREFVDVLWAAFALIVVYAGLYRLTVFRDRTIDEVIGFLRRIDWQELRLLFDHEEEEKLKGFWTRRNYRRVQRARLDQACEFLRCMCHNCFLLFLWSNTERKDKKKHHLEYDPQLTRDILDLVEITKRFRRVGFWIRCKVAFFSLLNFDKLVFLPIPSVVALRTVGDTDLIELYAAVKKAAGALASVYGEESVQAIMGTM